MVMKSRKLMAISCKNGNNNAKGSDFYKELMIFKKLFDRNNATNCYIIYRNI